MRKREAFGEPAYFDDYVAGATQSILLFEAKAKAPDTKPAHRRRLCYTIFREKLQLLIARYSRGEDNSVLQAMFPQVVAALTDYHSEDAYEPFDFQNLDDYVRALWLVSFAILFDAGDQCVNQLYLLINQEGQDALFDWLVALCVSGYSATSSLLYANPYAPLYSALDATDKERNRLIDQFLKQYYEGMRTTYWHNTHLKEQTGFFGYWCFELAAVVKMLQIDDSTFANNLFYPRDLTGRTLFRTWEDSEEGEADRREYRSIKKS